MYQESNNQEVDYRGFWKQMCLKIGSLKRIESLWLGVGTTWTRGLEGGLLLICYYNHKLCIYSFVIKINC